MMKKIFLFLAMFASFAAADAQLVIRRTTDTGSSTYTYDKLNFNQKADGSAWSFGPTTVYSSVAGWNISNLKYIATQAYLDENPQLDDYVAPTYVDDYRSIASWNYHTKWNLANVHDPTVMKAVDGYYYMYQTDASYGNAHTASGGHFYCRRSRNLVDWEYVGVTMETVPAWIKDSLNNIRSAMGLSASTIDFSDENSFGFWAPCARRVNDDLYRMYYAITLPGTLTSSTSVGERCFIGMMETSNPSDCKSWVDKGMVVTQYSDQNLNWFGKSQWGGYYKYNAIDPSYIITPEGEHWLVYGSWHSGFPVVQLDPETGKTLTPLGNPWGNANEVSYGKRIFTRQSSNRWQGSEAPEVVYHDGYYYLFIAFDELAVAYNTRVVRSKNIDGPYVDMMGLTYTNGTSSGSVYPILTHPYKFSGDQGWVGISHCAVFDDGNDNWYYASQQRLPEDYTGNAPNAVMLGGIRRILWTEKGWPVVLPERYGAVPQVEISEADIPGTWENITLSYNYQKQDVSVTIKLNTDHTISGSAFSGMKWSFDESKDILTIGSYSLCVARECDWESNPRKATIVYGGYNASGSYTFWGKKVSDETDS